MAPGFGCGLVDGRCWCPAQRDWSPTTSTKISRRNDGGGRKPMQVVGVLRRIGASLGPWFSRALVVAVISALFLAMLEFASVVLLYPVFGFLAQASDPGAAFVLPIVGISLTREDARVLAAIALGLMILRAIAALVYRRWWTGVTAKAELELSHQLLRAYAYGPYVFHLRNHSADLMARAVANVNVVCNSGLISVVGFVADAVLVLGLAAALVVADPTAGVVTAGYLTIIGGVYVLATKGIMHRMGEEYTRTVGRVYSRVAAFLRGIRELMISGARAHYLNEIETSRRQMLAVQRRMMFYQDVPRAVLEVTLYSTILIFLVLLLGRGDSQEVLPLVALYVLAGTRMMPAMARALGNLGSARTAMRVGDSILAEMAQLSPASQRTKEDVDPLPERSDLTLKGVSFSYENDLATLAGINLRIPFGTYVGVIGESGSGKTTLTALVLGLLSPTSGSIQYGGEVVEAGASEWFSRVAVVPQEVFLTDESILENITLGSTQCDYSRLNKAIEDSELRATVDQLPQGLQTTMGEGGSRLSAGQRQRVGLARALYRAPEILVLDEPTSALDRRTEEHVVSSILRLRGTMTIIGVAHRLHTLKGADEIIRIENGRIAWRGSPRDVDGSDSEPPGVGE